MTKLSTLLLSAAALCGVTVAQAQDKATLDLLVKKGLITQAEADELTAAAAKKPEVTTKDTLTRKITVGGLVQARASYIHESVDGADPVDQAKFTVRRAILTFTADLGKGWGACVSPELDASRNGVWLDKAVVTNTSEHGVFNAGLRKVNFGREEYVSAATELLPVERSVVTRALAGTRFASYHTGVYWDGKVKDSGLIYGAALTNAATDFNTANTNDVAAWANVGYIATIEKDVKVTTGMNLGCAGTMNNTFAGTTMVDNYGNVFGYNPYVTLNAGKLTVTGEILGLVANGKSGREDATPFGYNLTAAFRATDELEPVVRLSQLKGDVDMASTATAVVDEPAAGGWEDAWSLYAGANYYIMDNNLKLQGGYEFSQLTGGTVASKLDAHAVRVQIQAMF